MPDTIRPHLPADLREKFDVLFSSDAEPKFETLNNKDAKVLMSVVADLETEIFINAVRDLDVAICRCDKCNAILIGPDSMQCLKCGHDWH
jgi:hypothetical protein